LRAALPAIVDLAHESTESIAADALQEFHRLLGVIPGFARLYVTEVLDFLGRSHRDRFNHSRHSDRHQLYLSLYEQRVESVYFNAANIHKAAMSQAKDDPRNIFLKSAPVHGFEDQSIPFPTFIAVVIIDGNLRLPSSYSRYPH
jgi:hypothetical protein